MDEAKVGIKSIGVAYLRLVGGRVSLFLLSSFHVRGITVGKWKRKRHLYVIISDSWVRNIIAK